MIWPKISVVTPSFNQGRFIEETITSVIHQDYPDLEYLIFDGGSTDNTLEVIRKYEDRIDFWVSEPDKGQTDAVQKGFKRATGEIIGWINSDDQYYSRDVLKKVALFFLKNEDVDLCYGDNVYIDENNNLLYLRKGIPFYSRKLLYIWDFIHQPTVFMRRRVIEEFELNTSLQFVMDYEYWMRVAETHKFKYINLLISASRWHSQCKTISGTGDVFSELKSVYEYLSLRQVGLLVPSRYLYKVFFALNRLYGLLFLPELNKRSRDIAMNVDGWGQVIKRQVLGLRLR